MLAFLLHYMYLLFTVTLLLFSIFDQPLKHDAMSFYKYFEFVIKCFTSYPWNASALRIFQPVFKTNQLCTFFLIFPVQQLA